MIEFLVKHFVLVGLLLAGSLLIKKRSAAFRHSYWLIGFVWIAVLPLLVVRLPQIAVKREQTQLIASISHVPLVRGKIVSQPQKTRPPIAASEPKLSIEGPDPTKTAQLPWASILLSIYLLGVAYGSARLVQSLWTLRLLLRRSRPASYELRQVVTETSRLVGLRRAPRLVAHSDIAVPMTFGIINPVVVVPNGGASRTSLLHECAHIRRGDWFALVFARLLACIFWFDPLLLMAEKQLRTESETAADDVVVLAGIDPTRYASELVNLASQLVGRMPKAGLAIVGAGDLKTRVKLILGLTPRESRVTVRSAAMTMLLGGLMVMPFAAMHLVQQPVLATTNDYIDFGNGNWLRIIAISEVHGNQATSWNMKGELLPRAIGPAEMWVQHPPKDEKGEDVDLTHVLVVATNIHDMNGFQSGNDATHLTDGLLGASLYPTLPQNAENLQTIHHEGIWCIPFSFHKSDRAAVYVTVPTGQDYKTAATATWSRGKFSRTTDPQFVPLATKPGDAYNPAEITFSIPSQVHGQLKLDMEGSAGKESQLVDSSATVAKAYLSRDYFGSIKAAQLQYRAPLLSLWIRNIPTHPTTDAIAVASMPPGVDLMEATNDRYVFGDGQTITLESITKSGGIHPRSWTPRGMPRATDRQGYDSSVTDESALPGESIRALKFSVSKNSGRVADGESVVPYFSLFDSAGLENDVSRTVMALPNEDNVLLMLSQANTAKPQDLIVRVADPSRAKTVRLPLSKVYAQYKYGKAITNQVVNDVTTDRSLSGTRRPEYSNSDDDIYTRVDLTLIDSSGHPLNSGGQGTDGEHDDYYITKAEASRVAWVRVVTMPYVYIRFPQVAMNPTQSGAN